jgi:membrane protein
VFILERINKCLDNKACKYLITLAKNIANDDVTGFSAELTYYLVLAIFPFLIFLINVLSFTNLGGQALVLDFAQYLPEEIARIISTVVTETVQSRSGLVLVIAMLGTLWTSTKGSRAIIKGLNRVYNIKERRPPVKLYLASIVFVIVLSLIILLSIVLLVFGEVIAQAIFSFFGLADNFFTVWAFMQYGISIFMIFLTFMFLYKFAPNANIKFSKVWKGSLFAVIGWIAVSRGFAFYVNNFGNYQVVYGSIGGMIVFLLWLYFSSMVIMLGGEINKMDYERNE